MTDRENLIQLFKAGGESALTAIQMNIGLSLLSESDLMDCFYHLAMSAEPENWSIFFEHCEVGMQRIIAEIQYDKFELLCNPEIVMSDFFPDKISSMFVSIKQICGFELNSTFSNWYTSIWVDNSQGHELFDINIEDEVINTDQLSIDQLKNNTINTILNHKC